MRKSNYIFSVLILSIGLNGCGLYKLKPSDGTVSDKTEQVISNVDTELQAALKDIPKEDCLTIYKIFSGIAMYIEKPTNVVTTLNVFKLISDVEKDYGWETKKYPDLTEVIRKDLTEQGFNKPQTINDELKAKIVKTFKGYASSVKTNITNKK